MSRVQTYILKRYLRLVKNLIVRRRKHDNIPLLRRLFDMVTRRNRMPKNIDCKRFHIADIPAALLTPKDADSQSVMLYLHGGGYVVGSINSHKAFVGKIAKTTGITALLIDYRLAPEHPCPAAVDDALAAYLWLLEQGTKPENIVIAGDSAGGGLTLATLLAIKQQKHPMPATAICLSPWTDLAATGESVKTEANSDPMIDASQLVHWGKHYAGECDLTDPFVSPLYADLTGFPPLFIQVGFNEVLRDDSVRLHHRAMAAGIAVDLEVWDDMFHVWQFFWPYIKEANDAIKHISQHIHKHLGKAKNVKSSI